MKGKIPVQDAWASRVSLRYAEPVEGGGGNGGRGLVWGSWAGEGGFSLASQSRELESHLILASKIQGLELHLSSASHFGKSFRQVIWASFSCTSIWQGFIASKFSKYSGHVRGRREVNFSYPLPEANFKEARGRNTGQAFTESTHRNICVGCAYINNVHMLSLNITQICVCWAWA